MGTFNIFKLRLMTNLLLKIMLSIYLPTRMLQLSCWRGFRKLWNITLFGSKFTIFTGISWPKRFLVLHQMNLGKEVKRSPRNRNSYMAINRRLSTLHTQEIFIPYGLKMCAPERIKRIEIASWCHRSTRTSSVRACGCVRQILYIILLFLLPHIAWSWSS